MGTPVQIGSGFDDAALAITPDGQTAYVAQNATDTVVPVNLATGAQGGLIDVGQEPTAIAITPDGRTAYVVTGGQQIGGGGVVPIDTATNTAGPPINAGLVPTSIAIAPNGQTAYVVNEISDSLTPIDLATDKPESAIFPVTSPYNGGPNWPASPSPPTGRPPMSSTTVRHRLLRTRSSPSTSPRARQARRSSWATRRARPWP